VLLVNLFKTRCIFCTFASGADAAGPVLSLAVEYRVWGYVE
jgi:hypothetical protein